MQRRYFNPKTPHATPIFRTIVVPTDGIFVLCLMLYGNA